ncbi:hypothetical protein [Sphingomonas sp. UYEF23]|uniref:hypothetical protein n=1 Tax=Sphingomonas sp. UYEF23 TaxID=1756408 RepID=UPI003390EE31
MELAHAVGDHVLPGQDCRDPVLAEIDQNEPITFRQSVKKRRGNNLKSQFEIRMYPATRRNPRALRSRKAERYQLGFESLLPCGCDIEVARRNQVIREQLYRSAAN